MITPPRHRSPYHWLICPSDQIAKVKISTHPFTLQCVTGQKNWGLFVISGKGLPEGYDHVFPGWTMYINFEGQKELDYPEEEYANNLGRDPDQKSKITCLVRDCYKLGTTEPWTTNSRSRFKEHWISKHRIRNCGYSYQACWRCNDCWEEFDTERTLNRHWDYNHYKEYNFLPTSRLFVCHNEGCNKSYTKRTQRNDHEKKGCKYAKKS